MKNIWVGLVLLIVCAPAGRGQTRVSRLEGQVVCCEECWVREDRKAVPYGTASDLARAADCVAKGDPTLLAVMDGAGKTLFYQLEEGDFKRGGQNWLPYVGRRVEIVGQVRTKGARRFLRVDELRAREPAPKPGVVGAAPALSLTDLFGVEQNLGAYRGRVVILNFWATYCVPCRQEMPDLAAVQNEYAALGVQVIGASADTLSDREKVLQFIRETKVNFPIWLGATIEDMARFGLGPALPGTAIIGRDGRIVWTTAGMVKEADLRRQIETLLRPPAPTRESSAATSPARASSVPS